MVRSGKICSYVSSEGVYGIALGVVMTDTLYCAARYAGEVPVYDLIIEFVGRDHLLALDFLLDFVLITEGLVVKDK